jgi:hypothetical protein
MYQAWCAVLRACKTSKTVLVEIKSRVHCVYSARSWTKRVLC